MNFRERVRAVAKSTVFVGAFTAFLGWAAYNTFSSPSLKPGGILLGLVLAAGALWNAYLFGVMLVTLTKMKKLNQSPQPTPPKGG